MLYELPGEETRDEFFFLLYMEKRGIGPVMGLLYLIILRLFSNSFGCQETFLRELVLFFSVKNS